MNKYDLISKLVLHEGCKLYEYLWVTSCMREIVIPILVNVLEEGFEDTKAVIRIRKSKDTQHNGQKEKQQSAKHTHKIKIE